MNPLAAADVSAHTISSLLQRAKQELASQHDSASLDAEVLLSEAIRLSRAQLHAHPEKLVDPETAEKYLQLIARRARGEPVAYLTGYREFWSLCLRVTPATLIPRPETELLVEHALELIDPRRETTVLDLGTGSGAIALAIAKERPLAQLTAVDISTAALAVAEDNARRLMIGNVSFLESDWFSAVADVTFDIIVANPPYIAPGDPYLAQGDLRFEPDIALSCGADGLAAAELIIRQGQRYLNRGGWLLMEHGYNQAQALVDLLTDHHWHNIKNIHDYSGQPRLVMSQHLCV